MPTVCPVTVDVLTVTVVIVEEVPVPDVTGVVLPMTAVAEV